MSAGSVIQFSFQTILRLHASNCKDHAGKEET